MHVHLEGLLESKIAHIVATGIEVEKPVEADALLCSYVGSYRHVVLQTSASAYPHDLKRSGLRLGATLDEVDVDKSVELVENDIDVVTTNTGGESCDSFAAIRACYGVKLSTLGLALARIKELGDGIDPTGISYDDYLTRELLRMEMEVENRAVGV